MHPSPHVPGNNGDCFTNIIHGTWHIRDKHAVYMHDSRLLKSFGSVGFSVLQYLGVKGRRRRLRRVVDTERIHFFHFFFFSNLIFTLYNICIIFLCCSYNMLFITPYVCILCTPTNRFVLFFYNSYFYITPSHHGYESITSRYCVLTTL